jgi:hypothetical protein
VSVANNGGWSRVTNAVVHAAEISDGAFRCLLVLRSHCIDKTVCWPGEDTLAAELGCSLSTVGRRVAELEWHELIEVKRRGLGKTNVYTLLEKFSPSPDGGRARAERKSPTKDQDRSQATDQASTGRSEMVVYDPSNLTGRSRGSSEVEKVPSGGAAATARASTSSQALVAYFVREFRTRLRVEPPRDTIGQVAKEIHKLVTGNCDAATIERAIQIMVEKGLNPSSLSKLYLQAAAERGMGKTKLSAREVLEPKPDAYYDGLLFGGIRE